jgi:hypothetical protein
MIVLRALRQFFRTPPRALRIVLGAALAVEAAGFFFGIAPLGPVVREALRAHGASVVAGTLLFAACVCALHASIAAVVAGAALLTRRAPWLAGVLAAGPLTLAWFGFRAPFGYSVATSNVQLPNDTPLALLEAAAVHVALAALACIIVLVAVPFALIRRGGAEGGRAASNGGAS